MKKQLICICMAALLSLSLLTGCGAGTDTGDTAGTETKNVTVRLSEVTHSVFYAPQYVAMSQGFFADEGLDIELTFTPTLGSSRSFSTLIGADLHPVLPGLHPGQV